MLKRFLSYYRPHWKIFVLDMLASLAVAMIGIVYPIVTRKMLNEFIPNREYQLVVLFGLLLLGIYFIRMLLNYFIQYKGHVMGTLMQTQMRTDLFRHLQKLPFRFYDGHETGKIMSRITNDLFEITELAHHGPENLIISTISIVVSFVYLSTINIWLTLIIFVCVPCLLLVSTVLRKQMRKAFQKERAAVATINASVESSVSGIRVTKAFTNSHVEEEKFEAGNQEFTESKREAYNAMGKFHSGTSFITDVFNVVVLIAGGLFLYAGKIQLGDYSAFIVSVGLFITPVTTLINFMEQYQKGVTGFERFLELLDQEPERDAPDAISLDRARGEVELRDVTYAYDGEHDVLDGVSLKIPAGSTFALVGPSGGGKTTICHLIPRFYELNQGAILVDGIDIRRITAESLRKNIGIVQQDVYLFHASIRDNILYGRPDATEEEMIEAAKRANIHDYVMTLEKGYDTQVGERGVRLSGGQKQRISIARVFLKNPPILILDEATSALDNATELLIQQALDSLCKGRTTIVVAHRLSTVRAADEIAVIREGRVIEQGTHEALLKQNGTYAELASLQQRLMGEL